MIESEERGGDREGEREINEIKEIRKHEMEREDIVLQERAGRHAVKYGFTADAYRDVYIVFYSGKCVPEQ